jgi:hypothetical protein
MRNTIRILSLMLLACVSVAAVAEDPAAPAAPVLDTRVEAALDAAGLTFTADSGDFRMKYTLPDGRTQLVWVASKTAKIADTEFRDVWSVAKRGAGTLPAELAGHLLQENVRMVLGAWQVNQGQGEYLVVFSYAMPADATPGFLQEVLEAVTISADRIEMELTGQDEF